MSKSPSTGKGSSSALTSTGTWRSGYDISTLSSEYRHSVPSVVTFREVDSADTPLCQLADLMAGMAAYTRTNANLVRRQMDEPTDQGTLLGMSDRETPSTAEKSRFRVVSHLYWKCKAHRLGVSLHECGYLRTRDPTKPINFWHYEPQHRLDTAPIREGFLV